jgi:hypothetical protein
MGIMIRRAILAGTVAGMAVLGVTGQAFTGAALANAPSPKPSGTSFPTKPTPPTPPPDTRLNVTVTPDKAEPGAKVDIKAESPAGLVPQHAVAFSPVLDLSKLTMTGTVVSGTGQVRSDAKAGVYPVLVRAVTKDALKLRGSAQITVVVVPPKPPVTPTTPTNPTTTVPSGGVGTGGGGTSGGVDLALLTAGSAIALLGVTAGVVAMRRRHADVRD